MNDMDTSLPKAEALDLYNFEDDLSDDESDKLELPVIENMFDTLAKIIKHEMNRYKIEDESNNNLILLAFFGDCMDRENIEDVLYGNTIKRSKEVK